MKKFPLIISIVLLVLLSGCSFFSKKEDVPQAPPAEIQLERKTGVVNTVEALNILTSPSRFVLVIENSQPLLIDSASVNFRKYKGRRVEIEGKWNDEKTVFLVENVTSLTQDASSKTLYESPTLGLKFQYPSLWIIKEQQNVLGTAKIIITPYEVDETELDSVDVITIERSENNRRLSPREWLGLDEQYRATQNGTSTRPSLSEAKQLARPEGATISSPIFQQSRIGILQLDAVKSTLGVGEEIKFYVGRDTFIYLFNHKTVGDSEKDQYRNAFYDIVMSFEFIPLSESPPTSSTVSKPASTAVSTPSPSTSLSDLAQKRSEELKKQEEADKKIESLAQSKQIFIDYIKSRISELAPEPASVGGTWFVQSAEFAYPEGEPENFTAIYVVYEDGHDLRKILLAVADKNTPSSVSRVAYFKPGDSTDWQLAEGTDTAKGTERTKINVVSNGGSEISIKKGMTLLEARSFKIKIQYPSSWYWAYQNTGYSFSNKPVSGENVLVHLTKNPEILPETMSSIGELGGKPATEGEWAEGLSVCVQGNAKYCLSGDPSYKDVIHQMLETIRE